MANCNGSIGIDFGTTNTHFAYCKHGAGGAAEPQIIPISGSALVPTCLLWKLPCGRDESRIIAIGRPAEAAWFDLDDQEKAAHRFAANFKPDLLTLEQARTDAWAFLRKAYLAMQAANVTMGIGADEGMPVYIGVPAEICREQREITAKAASDAGFGEVTCVEEPLGALAFHMKTHDIRPSDARDGVLVIDFGGGTLDVALVNAVARGFRAPWGDPTLGGRLFDDLFYQWIRQQHPTLAIAPEDLGPFWLRGCRVVKETFSTDWSAGSLRKSYRAEVDAERSVKFIPESTAEFERRARCYTPSEHAQKYFRAVGGNTAKLADLREVDLFAWIARTICDTRGRSLQSSDFTRVLLTGGSCSWPFMRPLVAQTLGITDDRISISANPITAVGMGLTVYPIVRAAFQATAAAIKEARQAKTAEFADKVRQRTTRFAATAAQKCIDEVMPAVRNRFQHWHEHGGVLNDVSAAIDQDIAKKGPAIDAMLRQEYHTMTVDLERLRTDHIMSWLQEQGLARSRNELTLGGQRIELPQGFEVDQVAEKIAGDLAMVTTLASVISGIAVVVAALIKGHLILTLLVFHPIFGVAALLASIVGGAQLNEWLKKKIATYEWAGYSLRAMRLAMSDSRLNHALDATSGELRTTLAAEIGKNLGELNTLVTKQFDLVVDRVLEDLTVLEDFSGRES